MNRVVTECPFCLEGELVWCSAKRDFHTTYPINEVPLEIAVDIEGKWSVCPMCDGQFRARLPKGYRTVEMTVEIF